ncbi:MAG: hypothetical protein J3K34DRAFT_77677 [Monoraphidium minutum]|nr:MAG: hypothetical protein J3K34DRAFT_77677 [Monoraphidium minutum]
MQPAHLALLAALVASIITGLKADHCPSQCNQFRTLPGGVTSHSYCLVSVPKGCDFVDTTNNHKNADCAPCYLWVDAQSKCNGGSPPETCKKKFVISPDNCAQNVWKVWPSNTAWTGIEDMADGKQAGQMNYLWSNLWLSGVVGTYNPCANKGYKTLFLEKAPYGTMLINAFAYRTQHTWHAHMGPAHPELRRWARHPARRAPRVPPRAARSASKQPRAAGHELL